MAAVAHELDLYTTAGYSVHYRAFQAHLVPDLEPIIYQALAQVLHTCPTLFAVPIVIKDGESYFARLPSIDLTKVTSFIQRQSPMPQDGKGRDYELDAVLQHQVNKNFKSQQGILPVWRMIILHDFHEKQHFTASFMAHHAIADGASFQILHQAFHQALNALSSSATSSLESRDEYIISPKEDDGIGPCLEAMHSLPVPENIPKGDGIIHNDWLGNPTEVPSKTGYTTLTLPSSSVDAFAHECKKNRIATPAGLNALIAKVLYSSLPSETESMDVNIPVDIRPNLPPKLVYGVMGNFFDAFRTRVFRSDFYAQDSDEPIEIWKAARKIQADTRTYFSNTSPSGEAHLNIAALKTIPNLQTHLKSLIGGPRTESLELAYIGPHVAISDSKTRNDLSWQAGKVTVSRCAFALGACVQLTAVLHAEGMTIGFAWPVCAIQGDLVEKAIDGIRAYFTDLEELSRERIT